jgi:hypothetical protein
MIMCTLFITLKYIKYIFYMVSEPCFRINPSRCCTKSWTPSLCPFVAFIALFLPLFTALLPLLYCRFLLSGEYCLLRTLFIRAHWRNDSFDTYLVSSIFNYVSVSTSSWKVSIFFWTWCFRYTKQYWILDSGAIDRMTPLPTHFFSTVKADLE